jgi:UPF0271 protein
MSQAVDINADLGEGVANETQLLPYISSCSIACGGHYGDHESMRATIRLAKRNGVKVGAHPSFPDRDNFGRKLMTLTKEALSRTVFEQVLAFMAACELEAVDLHHVKLHGALYNYAAADAATADAVVAALEELKVRCYLYCLHGSVLHQKAKNLFPLKFEGFIDRRYHANGLLVSRSQEGAVIDDPQTAWRQLFEMLKYHRVETVEGDPLNIVADTFCIHGDHPNSLLLLEYIDRQMKLNNFKLDR